ncbi:phage holin [Staphylococcus lloydii]|uniref:phage holin n=1 Tax=Staphylococcus lloydii TaxID=2781774 RepID=UPI0029276EAD|nr:phage holin [Staphylococcus lloydii]MDU9418043.1 phage holin [Staphylococcus lloydii]
MNFILRLKNKATLTAIVGAILLFIKQITEAFGVDLSEQIEQVSGLIGAIITFLVGIGVVTDPTTKGVKDSGIAQTYSKPRNEQEDPVEYQSNEKDLKAQIGIMTPQEYDTSEPFTDDSDEVDFDVAEYEDDEDLPRGASKFHDDDVLKVSDDNDSKSN